MPERYQLIAAWAGRLIKFQNRVEALGLTEFTQYRYAWFSNEEQAQRMVEKQSRLRKKHKNFLNRFWPGHGHWKNEDVAKAMHMAMTQYYLVLSQALHCHRHALVRS
ncbi:MAG: hypothetical protein Q8P45_01445 [Candidatus Harrisonbacteria bacterium]|nr:hypothetical protein [Candidatus Harrisonbacteria bacterium]